MEIYKFLYGSTEGKNDQKRSQFTKLTIQTFEGMSQLVRVCQPYVGMSHLWRYVNVGKFYSEIAYCEGFYAYVQGCKVNWAWCISIHRILDATQLSHSGTSKFQVETLLFTLSISPSMMSQWTF